MCSLLGIAFVRLRCGMRAQAQPMFNALMLSSNHMNRFCVRAVICMVAIGRRRALPAQYFEHRLIGEGKCEHRHK